MIIEPEDLDRALTQEWSADTCLLQQASIRQCGRAVMWPPEDMSWLDRGLANELMCIFDESQRFFTPYFTSEFSESEALTGLCLLRAMLPMDV